MILSWHVSMHAGVLAGHPDPEEGGLVGLVTDLVERLGGPGAGLAVALENLFPPIPSEVILPLAGFAAGQGKMNLFAAIAWTTLGSMVGAVALYYVGVVLGRDRVRAIAGRLPLVKLSDVDRTEAWFARHGAKAVFLGRMIPIFRSLISIPAGVERMPVGTFLLYTTLGSLIWNTIFVLAGDQRGGARLPDRRQGRTAGHQAGPERRHPDQRPAGRGRRLMGPDRPTSVLKTEIHCDFPNVVPFLIRLRKCVTNGARPRSHADREACGRQIPICIDGDLLNAA